MNVEELHAAYPGAKNAVELCERMKSWEMFRTTAEVEGIHGLKERMRQTFKESIKTAPTPEIAEALQEAFNEWDHPDVLRYLAVKVGLV